MWMINKILEAKQIIEDMECNLIGAECTFQGQDAMIHNIDIYRETIEIVTYDEDGYEDQFIELPFEQFETVCS